MNPFATHGAFTGSPARRAVISTRFDTTLHSFSRWAGYAALGAAYVGVGCYFLS